MTNVVMAGVGAADAFVECASTDVKPKGRLFRKQFLHWGEFSHPNLPGKKINVDKAFADKLISNFDNKVCDIVQVPIVDGKNHHTEDPTRNVGQVLGIETDDKGVYALIDARKAEVADELGKTLIGASAMMNLDYKDTKTGERVGPTLLHMAVTNRPYITGLSDFDEVLGLSADTSSETTVLLGADADADEESAEGSDETEDTEQDEQSAPEAQADDETDGDHEEVEDEESDETDSPEDDSEETLMDQDALIAALKDQYGIDVEDLLVRASNAEQDIATLTNAVGGDDEDELTLSEVAEAVLELAAQREQDQNLIGTLMAERDALRLSAAEDEIDALVREGRLLPKQRERMLKLSMEDRETFEDLLPDTSIVSLSEEGVTTHQSTHSKTREDEVDRLLQMAPGAKK